jgi:hypothetical protein
MKPSSPSAPTGGTPINSTPGGSFDNGSSSRSLGEKLLKSSSFSYRSSTSAYSGDGSGGESGNNTGGNGGGNVSQVCRPSTVAKPSTGRKSVLRQTLHTYVEWAKKNERDAIKWTIFDDRRIVSLDDLHSRMRDYHVANSPPVSLHPLANELFEREFEAAFQYYRVMSTSTSSKAASRTASQGLKTVSIGNMSRVLTEELTLASIDNFTTRSSSGSNKSSSGSGVTDLLWIHVTNCSCMSTILAHFRVSHIFQLYFSDERPHSSFISSSSELILTLMSIRLGRHESATLNKIYIYIRDNLCITFEMDPVPNLDNLLDDENEFDNISGMGLHASSWSSSPPPTYSSGMNTTTTRPTTATATPIATPTSPATSTPTSPSTSATPRSGAGTVVTAILQRLRDDEIQITNPTQLLCDLATQNLLIQTSLLEFCSISIFYFRNQLNQVSFEMIKGDADRKVRVIESCLMLLKSFASDAEDAIEGANLDYIFVVQGKGLQ